MLWTVRALERTTPLTRVSPAMTGSGVAAAVKAGAALRRPGYHARSVQSGSAASFPAIRSWKLLRASAAAMSAATRVSG